MVTYFNRKDLVSFGSYLLSETRKNRIDARIKNMKEDGLDPLPLEEGLQLVYHADIENWIEETKKS